MSSTMIKPTKFMKRAESRKSHSWWWDSHISPKNSKWLSENLEEMDQSVKRMLKLIEEDADSFAKKAEMYYQKRPQLVSHVEEFYRMYRSLAERYDILTGELRKNVPSAVSSPDHSVTHQRSAPQAAFEPLLGSGGSSSELGNKELSESDYESDSDESSVDEQESLRRKIMELEDELREVKEKLLEANQGESRVDEVSKLGMINKDIEISCLLNHDQEIRELKEGMETMTKEKSWIEGEIMKLSKEKMVLEDNLKELELNYQLIQSQKLEMDELLKGKKDHNEHMEWHLKQMHMENIKLVNEIQQGNKRVEELVSRGREMEEEIEKQRVLISEGEEGKKEAIRQLCFSIEHYRTGYRQLRMALPLGQKCI